MENDVDYGSIKASKSTKVHLQTKMVVDAAKIFLLMPKNIPISRSARFQWLLDNLNNVVTVSDNSDGEKSSDNLEIIAAVGGDETHVHQAQPHMIQYRISTHTELVFLSRSYRIVYCLDMSPSQSAVDIGQGEILFDEIINCFRISLRALCRQFAIGGNCLILQPCLYLTVIVNTPFFISPAQQVLIKGVQVSCHNVEEIVAMVQGQFHHLEGRIAEVSAMAYEQINRQQARTESSRNSNANEANFNIPMVSPDANFVNMLRYSMLAISLLPENCLSNIIVITDGVAAMPDSNIMESILYQLHYDSISLSFFKVGSCFHWNSSAGYVSYTDLLLFLSHSTLGTYLARFPVVKSEPTLSMNLYQELYLLWTYNCKDKIISSHLLQDIQNYKSDEFQPSRLPTLLSKRQTEENVNASMLLLISRRMREGYTVNEVCISNGMIDVKLSLHWKSFIYIHYFITTQWPVNTNISHLQVFISAPYDFLHDITCCLTRRETIKSAYRQAVFERFWVRMTQLTTADNQLSRQLSAMLQTTQWYSLPESVRNGVPVLVLATANTSANSCVSDDATTRQLLLSATDAPACRGFADVWMALCQMHTNNWRKWLHTHKMSLILRHDHPLPKHMHLANASGRFQMIQCRQATMSLYRLLSTWSSFVLIESHTYLKLLYADEQQQQKPHPRYYPYNCQRQTTATATATAPAWFCIVRVSSKLPCATLHLGFVSGTPGHVRYNVLGEMRHQLDRLSHVAAGEEMRCCTIMQKPLEKILIKYERMPNDFHTVIFPDGTEPPYSMQSLPASPLAGTLFTTLSRYLFHQRWVWCASHPPNPRLGIPAISRILNTLTRMRLWEGFKFAHSAAGIVTMVLELDMIPSGTCVVQYVLFPPHSACWGEECSSSATTSEQSTPPANDGGGDVAPTKTRDDEVGAEEQPIESDDEESGDSELQIVTEVWIEPQYGCVKANQSRNGYMNNKYYYELSDLIRLVDLRCIHALLTLEHLNLICQRKYAHAATDCANSDIEIEVPIRNTRRPSRRRYASVPVSHDVDSTLGHTDNSTPWNPFLVQRIQHIAFKFDAIDILPLCRKTELLFSMLIEPIVQASDHFPNRKVFITPNQLLLENIHHHLNQLNDAELVLSSCECFHLVRQLRQRCIQNNQETSTQNRIWLLQDDHIDTDVCDANYNNLWRCFVKGVSITHVILTFAPKEVSHLLLTETTSLKAPASPTLPIYVFDCALAMLVDCFVRPSRCSSHENDGGPCLDSVQTLLPANSVDSYEDRRYHGNDCKQDRGARVCSARNSNSDSTTVKSEETEQHRYFLGGNNSSNSNRNTATQQQHCKALVLSHSKCFTLSVFVALHYRYTVHSIDMQSALEQCWETQYDIDISDYIRNVCGHMKHSPETINVQVLNQPTPCSDLAPLHRLIKDNFLRVVTDARFSPVPSNKRFYYYSKNESDIGDNRVEEFGSQGKESSTDDDRPSHVTSNSTNTLASEKLVPDAASDYSSDNILEVALDFTTYGMDFLDTSSKIEITTTPSCVARDGRTEILQLLGNYTKDIFAISNISPLFLQFVCSVRYENIHFKKALKLLPTCLGEVMQSLSGLVSTIDKAKLRVSLDIVCLTLPIDIQNVINDYSTMGMRSTSFCSDGFLQSTRSSVSDNSFTYDFKDDEAQFHIPDDQRNALCILKSEIKWLLRNESITSMLDVCCEPIAQETLDVVVQHVEDSWTARSCCSLEVVRLSFVCAAVESHALFVHEFPQITVSMSEYRLCKQADFYYLAKNQFGRNDLSDCKDRDILFGPLNCVYAQVQEDTQSETSSIDEVSVLSTSTGYDEDVSGDEESFDWLIEMANERAHLPNFWLIMQLSVDAVRIYFHCRFVDLLTNQAVLYKSIQQNVVRAIHDLCKRVNQSMLLQQLYETRVCSSLLEPEESFNEFGNRSCLSYTRLRTSRENDHIWRAPKHRTRTSKRRCNLLEDKASIAAAVAAKRSTMSLIRSPLINDHGNSSDDATSYEPGHFKCPVIWEHPFSLHPRLKTGVGKCSLNVGFNAMTSVLEKFNVVDRRNMFVIRSKSGCVFYLYLYEHIQSQLSERRHVKLQGGPTVTRTASIASLPAGQAGLSRSALQAEPCRDSYAAPTSGLGTTIRPRVHSFGDKETGAPIEDCIVLKVRGIPPICDEISCELVGVLQNRLDDTVLEFLSVTLARNWRCPLTPEDVMFLKKPSRLPDRYITVSLNCAIMHSVDAFYYYLKENLLQWMNVPNYTDTKFGQYHFRDNAPANRHASKYHYEENIYLFNQNQNPSSGQPSSGHHAIALISFCVIDKRSPSVQEPELIPQSVNELTELLGQRGPLYAFAIAQIISNSDTYTADLHESASRVSVQFRVWKNGRLNWDLLTDILVKAVSQTQWDLITEFYLLRIPLCIDENIHHNIDVRRGGRRKEMDATVVADKSIFVPIEASEIGTKGKARRGLRQRSTYMHETCQQTYAVQFYMRCARNGKCGTKPPPQHAPATSEVGLKTPVLTAVPICANENGLSGIFPHQYWAELGEWLSFGEHLGSPNVRKCTVQLNSQDNLNIIAREVSNQMSMISQDTVRGFCFTSMNGCYVPFDYSMSPDCSPLNCHQQQAAKDMPVLVLFARNNQYWKLQVNAIGSSKYPEAINSSFLLHSQYQRTLPALVQNRTFVPRQKMSIAIITRNQIVFFTYNWNKDNAERLADLQNAQSLWLNARSASLSSGIQAKLGHFYNLPYQRQTIHTVYNPYMRFMQEPDVVATFQPDKIRKSQLLNAVAASAAFVSSTVGGSIVTVAPTTAAQMLMPSVSVPDMTLIFRDRYIDNNSSYYADISASTTDSTLSLCHEMRALNALNASYADIRHLQNLYISGENFRNLEYIKLIYKYGRIIHYCHTPMLFLSKWRIATAATRDQSLIARGISDLNFDDFESWHNELCVAFVTECTNYIKKLGFHECPIKSEQMLTAEWKETGTINVFLQKNIMGGLMIYIIAMVEPFITTKLIVVECDRFLGKQPKRNQFSLTFLDECDRIRDTMHLHSFTYDFHLRSVSNYLSGDTGTKLYSGFHLTRFLDDFIRYYTKSPNYARNLVYTGEMEVSSIVTDGTHLYNYLLAHSRDYGFETVTMRERHDFEADYVLVQTIRVPHIVYTDTADRQHTDNFDLTLIASYVPTPHIPTREACASRLGTCYHTGWDRYDGRLIKLRFYIILTTRGDIYPKAAAERKLGKFRTVSINVKRNTNELDIGTPISTSAESPISSTLMPSDEDRTMTESCTSEDKVEEIHSKPSFHTNLHPLNLYQTSSTSVACCNAVPMIVGLVSPTKVHKEGTLDRNMEVHLRYPTCEERTISFLITETKTELNQNHNPVEASLQAKLSELDSMVCTDAESFDNEEHGPSSSNAIEESGTQFQCDISQPMKQVQGAFHKSISAALNASAVRRKSLAVGDQIIPDAPLSIPDITGFNVRATIENVDDNCCVETASSAFVCTGQEPEILQEKVNYLGYFSTHEQLMQNVMHESARSSELKLQDMVRKGTMDCRTHYLWDKLMTVCCKLSFSEFAELKAQSRLVHISHLVQAHVTALLAQPATWYEHFAKAIATWYSDDHSRTYASEDRSLQYWVALHHRYDRGCILVAIDFHANHGDMHAMERVLYNPESEIDKQDKQEFLDDFIQKLSYQIWLEMVNN